MLSTSQADDLTAYRLLIADVYELAGESRRSSEALARELDQTAARWHVLSVVSDGLRTVASSARRLGLARQSVQRVVDDLAAGGLVDLVDNPDHARAPLVALTDRGRTTLDTLIRRSDADRSAMLDLAGLHRDDLDAARTVIRALVAGLTSSPSTRT
jgi:DNA-binding MarR family transcriptional regulator